MIDEFKRTGQIPLAWQWRARKLIGAANLLHQQRETRRKVPPLDRGDHLFLDSHDVILLLYGLALENLLKALLVAQGVDATSTGQLNAQLKTHNLCRLWRQAGLALDDDVQDLLHRLRWSIEVGKYPVGLKPDPSDPSPIWLALTSVARIGELLMAVEDAIRVRLPDQVFEKTDLLKLCID